MNGNRQQGGVIVATYNYVDEDGHLLFQCVRYNPKNFKQRQPNGEGWIWNLDGVRRVLYRLPKLKDAGQVFVVEGERDVHTIEELGLIGTCNPMGAGKWRPEYAESLRGKQVVIIGDADEPGRKHAAKIAEDLLGVATEVQILELPNAKDVSDWVDRGGTLKQLEELVARTEPLVSHGAKKSDRAAGSDLERGAIPRTFQLTDQGLFKLVTKDGETQRIYLCGKLEVLSLTRDTRGDNWGKQVRFQDPDGRIHEFVISETSLASRQGEWFGQLKAGGLFVSPRNDVRGHLLTYLSEAMPTARMRTVNQVGWHGDVFVTPAWSEPAETPDRILLDGQSIGQHHFAQRGSLEQWRDRVSVLCRRNPVLIFAVNTAFAPSLLPLKNGLGGGFHLLAISSSGKTTVLKVAGSVWGGGGRLGFVESWNATANGVEAMAQAHNHSLLPLDELKELPADQAARVAYQLANGQGRQAMDRNRAIRTRQTWNLIFLSNGEFDFISHILTAEKRAYAGQEVRVTTIPVDREFGAFDCIHSAANAGEFAKMISELADDYYGTAARSFVTRLIEMGRPEISAELDRRMARFVAHNSPANAGAEVGRVLDRFALIAAAGELAAEWKITAWDPAEASAAVSDVFRSCLKHRGTVGSFDQRQALQHVRDYLLQFGPSRFQRHRAGKPVDLTAKIQNRVGFINEGSDVQEYQFVDHFPPEFTAPFNQEIILRALDSIGALVKEDGRQKVKRVVPGHKSLRCYVINHEILFSDTDD